MEPPEIFIDHSLIASFIGHSSVSFSSVNSLGPNRCSGNSNLSERGSVIFWNSIVASIFPQPTNESRRREEGHGSNVVGPTFHAPGSESPQSFRSKLLRTIFDLPLDGQPSPMACHPQ
jgi:hypothetical protein